MNKKKVDSILKGITAAGIAMGGVSSIQGADMVMAAINESAADSNSLVDAGSLSESERTEYSESTTQSMSERNILLSDVKIGKDGRLQVIYP